MPRRLLAWFVTALLMSSAALSTAVAGAPASIAVVVFDDAGVPVPGARVFLTGLSDSVHRVVEADDAGQAVFGNLPAGSFTLGAEKDGFARSEFGARSGAGPVAIALDEATLFRATLVIERLGAIAGVVSDDRSAPTAAEVRLFRNPDGSSGRRPLLVASTRSGQDGAFSFPSVAPGDYFVCARSTRRPDSPDMMAVPSCFGGLREPTGAPNLRVGAAGLAGNVNLFLTYETPARLQGKVIDPNGQPVVSTQVHIARAIDDGFGIVSVRTGAAGEFAATLLPGVYHLVVRGAGSVEAVMAAGATTEVLFPLGRGASFTGQIAQEAPGATSRWSVGTALFELVPSPSAFAHLMPSVPIRLTDATSLAFGASGIPPGDYVLRVPAELEWVLDAAQVGDRDLLADGVRVLGTDQIAGVRIALVRADAAVVGRLLGPDDAPLFDRQVVLFPEDRRHWPMGAGRVRWARPDTNGRFEMSGLPAGRFLLALVAWDRAEDWSSAFLESVSPEAVRVSIEQGQRLVQTFRTTTR